jgi:hypothetical protein
VIDLNECRQCAWLSFVRETNEGKEVSCSQGDRLWKPIANRGGTCPNFLRMPMVICPKPYRECRDRSRRGVCDRTIPRCAECLAAIAPKYEEGYVTMQLIKMAMGA